VPTDSVAANYRMVSNKNQHFVPKCYLRPFTLDEAGLAINLYNIDRRRVIEGAAVRHQCSGSFFYGNDPQLEKAIQATEGEYGSAIRAVLEPGYALTDSHREFLKLFWLFQHLRTEAASRRSVEMAADTRSVVGHTDSTFRLEIREAVQMAMHVFAESMNIVSDLKVCLIKNRTAIPFVTSDDPAILTNRWQLLSKKAKGRSFGLHSAGDILLLPLSPQVLCVAYDGDVYSIPHRNGWAEVQQDHDVEAFNQHQYLNCRANIFFQTVAHGPIVHEQFDRAMANRPEKRHVIHYAVLDSKDGDWTRYRVVDPSQADQCEEAIIHNQVVHAAPAIWPRQISWRPKGCVFTNGTGMGYVRRAWAETENGRPFWREPATLD
jgi:hypothetical protein